MSHLDYRTRHISLFYWEWKMSKEEFKNKMPSCQQQSHERLRKFLLSNPYIPLCKKIANV